MARVKQTEEEKAAKVLARKAAAKERKKSLWLQLVSSKQQVSLQSLDSKDVGIFQKLFSSYTDTESRDLLTSIEISIFDQFNNFGNLSEKQVHYILNSAIMKKRAKAEVDFYEEFKIDARYDLVLKLKSYIIEESQQGTYHSGPTNVFRFVNEANQNFKLKTNNQKILSILTETDKWYSMNANVRFIAGNGKHVVLDSKKLKFI